MNILDHPQIKDLNPQTEREGLLYLKAYFEAIDSTLKAAKEFGLEAVEDLHTRMKRQLEKRIEGSK
jgi:hypothetical protein